MSETVHYKGKLRKIEVDDIDAFKKETVENYLKTAPTPSWYNENDYAEFFEDNFYDTYIVNNGIVYEVLNQDNIDSDSDIFIANTNSEGTIDYDVMYYSGGCGCGCGFGKAIEEALNRMEENK